MNKAQHIKKIIGGAVKEHGFEYKGYTRDEFVHGYSFERRDGELIQYITISIFDGEARLGFMTNAYGQEEVYASDLIESDFEGDNEGLDFEDEEELRQILCHFRDIILQKGFEILESISKPTTEARPRRETHLKLYQEHEALNKEYREKYGLEETDSTMKLMKKISEVILAAADKEFSEVEEMLVGLTAVYADQLIRKCGGEWEWHDEYGTCIIDKVRKYSSSNPLALMIHYWRFKDKDDELYILTMEFKKTAYDTVD